MPDTERRHGWSVDAFLEWSDTQELRYEFDGVGPRRMVGQSAEHNRVVTSAAEALRAAIEARPPKCEVFRDAVRLRMEKTVRFPDIMMVCSWSEDAATYVTDPIMVVEVLSANTSLVDRYDKFREYERVSSILYYLILEEDCVAATLISRPDWSLKVFAQPEEMLNFAEINVSLPLGAFYAQPENAASGLASTSQA